MDKKAYNENNQTYIGRGMGRPLTEEEKANLPQGNIGQAFTNVYEGLTENIVEEPNTGLGISLIDLPFFGMSGLITKTGKVASVASKLKVGSKGFDLSRNGFKIVEEYMLKSGASKEMTEEAAKLVSKRIGAAEKLAKASGKYDEYTVSKILDKNVFQTLKKYTGAKSDLDLSKIGKASRAGVIKAGLTPYKDIEKARVVSAGKYTKWGSDMVIKGKIGRAISSPFFWILTFTIRDILKGVITDKEAAPGTLVDMYASGMFDTYEDEYGNTIQRTPEEAFAEFDRELTSRDLGDEKYLYVNQAIQKRQENDDKKFQDKLKKDLDALALSDAEAMGYQGSPYDTPEQRIAGFKNYLEHQQAQQQQAQQAYTSEEEARQNLFDKYGIQGTDVQKFAYENPNNPDVIAYMQAKANSALAFKSGFSPDSTATGLMPPPQTETPPVPGPQKIMGKPVAKAPPAASKISYGPLASQPFDPTSFNPDTPLSTAPQGMTKEQYDEFLKRRGK